jgi:hypothetical protein
MAQLDSLVSAAELAAAIAEAERVVSEQIGDKTKTNYASGIRQFVKFVKEKGFSGTCLDGDDKVKVPLPENVLKMFFALKQKKNNGDRASFSSLNGYRNALKKYYTDKKVSKAEVEKFDAFVQPFLQGKL